MRSMGATQEEYYRGVRMVPYDLVKEIVLAIVGVGVLALVIAALLSLLAATFQICPFPDRFELK